MEFMRAMYYNIQMMVYRHKSLLNNVSICSTPVLHTLIAGFIDLLQLLEMFENTSTTAGDTSLSVKQFALSSSLYKPRSDHVNCAKQNTKSFHWRSAVDDTSRLHSFSTMDSMCLSLWIC